MARSPGTESGGRSPASPDQTGRRTRDRILRAVIEWAEETGMRKLSMDEIAHRARLARATLYIHFPGRAALIDAAVRTELDRFFAGVMLVADGYEDPRERLVATFAHAYRTLREHRLVDAVMRLNPQLLLPYILGEGRAIDIARDFSAATMAEQPASELSTAESAELVVRAIHSFVLAPSHVFDLDTVGGAESYARRILVPLVFGPGDVRHGASGATG